MKKVFNFEEKVTYMHGIEYEVDANDVEAEITLDDLRDKIDAGDYDDVSEIVHDFRAAFGDSVKYIKDGSPDVRYEAY